MSRINCIALILRTQPYGEADLLVDLFTQQQGRARVIARGALKSKRRYMGVLEPGALVKVDYQLKPGLSTLGPCDVVSSHRKLRRDLYALRQLYYVLELVLVLTPEGDADELLFSSVVELLAALESAAGLPAALLYAWELRLFSHVGYHLRISRCPHTGLPPDGLSYQEGGSISSRSGRPHWSVSTETLRHLYCLQRGQYERDGQEISFSEAEDAQLRAAFSGIWSEITGQSLKSVHVFRKLNEPISTQVIPPAAQSSGSGEASPTSSLTHLNPAKGRHAHAHSSSYSTVATCLLLLMAWTVTLTSCQGMGEHLPSQATFEVQPSTSKTSQEARRLGTRPLQYPNTSLPHLSNHPQELPQNLDTLTRALRSERSSVSVALQVSSKGQLRDQKKVYCELNSSVLSAVWLTALTQAPLNLKQVQPKLWIEHQVPEQLRSHFKDEETLIQFLEREASVTAAKSPAFRRYNPNQDHEGMWVLYFPKRGNPQSLILTKNTSWMCERAWTIAACELNDTLVELTYAQLDLKRNLTSPLQLVLVSAEVHVHPVDE